MDLAAELARARELDEAAIADAIEAIGFECTRCGACCKGSEAGTASEDASGVRSEPGAHGDDEHTATVFPDEVRELMAATDYDWRDVARPVPFGLREGADGPEGETFEWALQTDDCGDCVFYEEDDGGPASGENGTSSDRGSDGVGACTVHADRPRICRTYPFSLSLDGTSQPMGEAVDREGVVRAHECEGLGRDISRADAEELAAALKERATTELREAIAVGENYEPADPGPGEVVVHDSEGAKRPDGTPYWSDRA